MSVYIKDAKEKAQACLIWLHGLGADASDMMGLVEQLHFHDMPLRHVFLDAPSIPVTINGGIVMPAWYDILGIQLADREDKAGIQQSAALIAQAMSTQVDEGLAYEKIFLAGFSQGGAMALHTALNTPQRLGGVIALSAYLPLATDTKPVLDQATPFFMGSGEFDPVVLPAWTQQSQDWLLAHGYKAIAAHKYPMEHTICYEEAHDVSAWVRQVLGVR